MVWVAEYFRLLFNDLNCLNARMRASLIGLPRAGWEAWIASFAGVWSWIMNALAGVPDRRVAVTNCPERLVSHVCLCPDFRLQCHA